MRIEFWGPNGMKKTGWSEVWEQVKEREDNQWSLYMHKQIMAPHRTHVQKMVVLG
jgi:hypothetical protein